MAYTLYYYELWPDAMAARIALAEQGDTATLDRVAMNKGEHKKPAFLALNPQGEPPVLVDSNGPNDDPNHGPFTVSQVLAIASYLNDKRVRSGGNPVLYPKDPCGISLAKQWASWTQSKLVPAVEQILLHTKILPASDRSQAALANGVAAANAALSVLETSAPNSANGEHFIAREAHSNPSGWFSFADITIGCTLSYARVLSPHLSLQAFPVTARYVGALEKRASFVSVLRGVTLP